MMTCHGNCVYNFLNCYSVIIIIITIIIIIIIIIIINTLNKTVKFRPRKIILDWFSLALLLLFLSSFLSCKNILKHLTLTYFIAFYSLFTVH